MLSKCYHNLHTRQLTKKIFIFPTNSDVQNKLVVPFDRNYQSSHIQSKFISVKSSTKSSKSPKIRTYVDYEKDFVRLQPSKCYSCYLVASAIGVAIAYEFWSNVKDIKPFSYLQKFLCENVAPNNSEEQVKQNNLSSKEKPYYLTRFVVINSKRDIPIIIKRAQSYLIHNHNLLFQI